MLWLCAGTAGELIKIYPVIRRAEERKLPWFVLSTGQSAVNFWKQWDDFRLPRERAATLLETSRDLNTSGAALRWFARAGAAAVTGRGLRRRIQRLSGHEPGPRDAWLVHGDTLSTLVGSRYARALGVPIAHIEAGLRSPSVTKPFPEEINRRLVSRMAHWHFTQDETATRNLEKAGIRDRVVCTGGNTLFDALRYVVRDVPPPADLPPGKYVVANIHRFENLASSARWKQIIDVLARAAGSEPVLLVQHPPTEEKLRAEPATRRKLEEAGVKLLPRQPFTGFVHLLERSDYVISDGGSNQEECSYLGKPCLLLRDSTERVEGLDGSCLLSRFEPAAIDRFLADPSAFRRPPVEMPAWPSDVILDTITREGFGA